AASLLARSPRLIRPLALLLAAAVCARAVRIGFSRTASEDSYGPYRVQAALWLRDNVPPEARIGSWNAGMIGYFSHRKVVCLDGLVNDVVYLDRVTRGRDLPGYLDDERIEWIADQACGPE